MEKKNFLLNCDVCDTRKIREEDYSHYEQMGINAEIVLVNERSKGVLNQLPLQMNQDSMIELAEDVEIAVKSVNGSYEITGHTQTAEHTFLIVNGSLTVETGTEEILQRYEQIIVNGSVKYPKSLEGYLSNMHVNGTASGYPDDCVILEPEFTIDRYFPLRAREGGKYYAEKAVIVRDGNVDLAGLAEKKVRFVTGKFLVPECKVEESLALFDERVELIVVPDGMTLLYGDSRIDKSFLERQGGELFVCGNLELDRDIDDLRRTLGRLIVKGTLRLHKNQERQLQDRRVDVEYERLEIVNDIRCIRGELFVRLDRELFDHSPGGIQVRAAIRVEIAEDVTPEMIYQKLTTVGCIDILCNESQKAAVSAVSKGAVNIGTGSYDADKTDRGDLFGAFRNPEETRMINADSYVM